MLVVIAYDISMAQSDSSKRWRMVHNTCLKWGTTVQASVFECSLDWSQFQELKETLLKIIDPTQDTVRFYLLGNNYQSRREVYGKQSADIMEDFIF